MNELKRYDDDFLDDPEMRLHTPRSEFESKRYSANRPRPMFTWIFQREDARRTPEGQEQRAMVRELKAHPDGKFAKEVQSQLKPSTIDELIAVVVGSIDQLSSELVEAFDRGFFYHQVHMTDEVCDQVIEYAELLKTLRATKLREFGR